MRSPRSAVIFVALALLAGTAHAQDVSEASLPGLIHGPMAVGFETLEEHDSSRTYRTPSDDERQSRENARPMLISVWYPTAATTPGPRMTFGDYVALMSNIESFQPASKEERSRVMRSFVTRDSAPDPDLEVLLRTETAAVRDAPPRAGGYPLLLYSPGGNGPPHENAILFEYLASHGYVVAHIPSYASRTFTKGDVAYDLPGVEAGTRDLEFMYAVMREHAAVDRTRIGVLGFSWGGLAASLFSARNHDVDALVSFDGGEGLADLLGGLDDFPQFDPAGVRVPILHFVSKPFWSSDRYRADYHTRIPHRNVYVLKFHELTHNQMASGPLLREVHTAAVAPDVRASKAREYEIIARYALAFLDAYLRGDPRGHLELALGVRGQDAGLGTVTVERLGSR